jgi:hypothetical protein
MAQPKVLNPHPPEFERFLYASVGEDRNGYVVTVLSAFARLGLDPWAESADLAKLGRDAARARVGNAACSISGRTRARKRSRKGRTGPEPAVACKPGVRNPEASCLDGGRWPPGPERCDLPVLAIIFVLFLGLMFGGWGPGQ